MKMYYEEKIIDGVLCYRSSPNGDFEEKSKFELTSRILDLEARIGVLEHQIACME